MADVEFAPVRVREDLHMDPVTVARLGFKIRRHWSDVEAVNEAGRFRSGEAPADAHRPARHGAP